jgi:hypothetical protein
MGIFFIFNSIEILFQLKKISIFQIPSVMDEVLTVCYGTNIVPFETLPENNRSINDDEHSVNILTDRLESPPYLIYGNGGRQFR